MIEATPMRKLINTLMAGFMIAGASIAISGCADETATKEEVKITTPSGTTTEKHSVTVDKSGQNPPVAPSEKVNP
jgi:hypothetical protein